jgi:hypothetical protein
MLGDTGRCYLWLGLNSEILENVSDTFCLMGTREAGDNHCLDVLCTHSEQEACRPQHGRNGEDGRGDITKELPRGCLCCLVYSVMQLLSRMTGCQTSFCLPEIQGKEGDLFFPPSWVLCSGQRNTIIIKQKASWCLTVTPKVTELRGYAPSSLSMKVCPTRFFPFLRSWVGLCYWGPNH